MAIQKSGKSNLTLEQGLGVAELSSSAQRLIILQGLADNYRANHAQEILKDQPAWSDLANEVGQETARLAALGRRNRKALLGNPHALESGYKSALDSVRLDDATKQKVTTGIESAGGIVAYVTSSLDGLDRALPAQRDGFFAFADQMGAGAAEQAQGEALINTTWKQNLVCFLYGVAIGASIGTGNVFGVAMGLAGAVNAGCFD